MFFNQKRNMILFFSCSLILGCNEPNAPVARSVNFKPNLNVSLAQAPQVCQDEVLKAQPVLEKFQSACFLAAQDKEKHENYGSASWYYLLSTHYQENLVTPLTGKKLEDVNVAYYANMAQSFVLNNNFNKAEEYYRYFLLNVDEDDVDAVIKDDLLTLEKLYPKEKASLQKAGSLWNRLYASHTKTAKLYDAYLEFERRREFAKTIPLLDKLIEEDERSIKYDAYANYYKGVKAHHQERYVEAIKFLEKAKESYRFKENLGIPYIYILSWLSESHTELREYKKALYYRDVLTKRLIKNFGKEHLYVAQSYDFTGYIYEVEENHAQALKFYKKSLALKEQMNPRNEMEIIASLNHISGVYYSKGEYSKALTMLQKVVEFNAQHLNPLDAELATNYNNMGTYYGKVGSDEKALKYYAKALNIRKQTLGKGHKHTALLYSEMGTSYQNLKRYKEAFTSFEKAIDIYEKNYGAKNEDLAQAYQALGELYVVVKKIDVAITNIKKALTIRKSLKNSETLLLADNYRSLASAYLHNHQTDLGISNLKRDLAIKIKILGEENHLVEETKVYIASLEGNYDDSYVSSKKVFDKFLNEQESYFAILENEDKVAYIKKSKENLYHLLGVTTHATKDKEQKVKDTFTAWLRYKGSLFDEENVINVLYKNSNDSVVKAEIDTLFQQKRALANLYQNVSQGREAKINALKESIAKARKTLSQKSRGIQELEALKSIEYNDVADSLKENQLYIDYAYLGAYYFIFTVNNHAEVTLEQLSEYDTKAINRAVLSFRKSVKRNREAKSELELLYGLLLKDKIEGKEELLISTDGLLRTLPFEALYDGKEKKYLIEKKTISYISSGKELFRLAHYRQEKSVNDTVVIFANPNFDAKLPATSRAVNGRVFKSFSKLQGTKEEAEAIKTILSGHNILSYEEERANETALLTIDAPKILHIATHGFFMKRKQPNPMLNSGIALSGANRAISSGQGEGIITALKLSGLHLKNTELVVLSACETGLTSSDSTESLSGLTKAFIEAGARGVVMSLWSVSDKGTKELMENFYQEINAGKGYVKALQEAKIAMIHEKVPPFIWAPFIINGK